jgi:hypothetical protein
MASHVTPGYNPEVSLLQGGTAPIVPVQGGGGMNAGAALPAGYNPDQSLLNVGQNAPIMAVRGGGQEGGDGEVAYDKYVIEQYDPPLVSIPIPKLPTTEVQKSLVQAYISFSKPLVNELKSFIADPAPYRSTGQDNPTYQICPTPGGRRRLPTNFFQGVRKRVVIVDAENPHIWILHNLQGNISKFLQYMKLIPQDKDGVLDPNHYVFLTGSFFSDDITNNLNFYNQFLMIKQKNMEHFYSINDLSEKFVNISCSIMNNIYSPVYLSKEGMRNTVFTFNEPDIVIFKKQHLLFKNSELPIQRDEMTINMSSVLEKPDPEKKYKSFLIVPLIGANEEFASNVSDAPNAKKYFILDFNPNTPKKIALPSSSDITCPKDQTCSNFKGGYLISKMSDDKRFDLTGVFHFYKNEDKMPFLKAPGSILNTGEEKEIPAEGPKKSEEEEEEKKEEEVAPLEEVEEPAELNEETKKLLAGKPMKFKRKVPDEPFKADPSAVKGSEQDIEVNAIIFRLRVPLDKKVFDDWKSAKFTQEEVEFLHALRFTPQLLSETFGKNAWKVRLATFMESLILSNCFQDTTLLMKLECSNAQHFVKQVYFQMYKRLLGDLYDEMGIVKPKTLSDIFAGLRGLSRFGPTKSVFPITKYDYTGDLLERFQIIHYNKDKEEYYSDFTKMTEATRELLQKMKLYRVEDKDIEEITKAILERMKIPIPLKKGPASAPPGSPPPPPAPPGSPPPPSTDPSLYRWEEIRDYSPISDTFFQSIYTKGDGLCFYRAILKGIQTNPVEDSEKPLVYNPNEADTMVFIREIKNYLLANKASVIVKSDRNRPVEEHFDAKYKAKAGEAKAVAAESNNRIRTNGVYKKLSFTEFINLLDHTDSGVRPYAEVQDAGIGTAAGRLKDVVIMVYLKVGPNYNLVSFYNEELAQRGPLPLSKFIFLHHVGGNHFNLLKLNAGSTWPHLKAGGQIEEVLELGEALEGPLEEVLDLGDAVPMEEKKRYRKRTLRNKNRKNRTTKKHRK